MVAARARSIYDQQAKARQIESGKEHGRGKVPENLPEPIAKANTDARDAAGKAVGVSGKTVDFATKVLTKGSPELVKAVDEGRVAVSTAAAIATDTPDEQRSGCGAGATSAHRRWAPGLAHRLRVGGAARFFHLAIAYGGREGLSRRTRGDRLTGNTSTAARKQRPPTRPVAGLAA